MSLGATPTLTVAVTSFLPVSITETLCDPKRVLATYTNVPVGVTTVARTPGPRPTATDVVKVLERIGRELGCQSPSGLIKAPGLSHVI